MEKRLCVAILLNDYNRSVGMGEVLQERGFKTVVANGTDELYDRAGTETFDILVLEQKLRGFLTGLEVLAKLHQQLVRPVTILLAEDRSRLSGRAAKLGVRNLLAPTIAIDTLLSTIEAVACNASSQSQSTACPLAKRIVAQAEFVEPLPQLLIRLSQLLREGDIFPEMLQREIAVDPRATFDVLRIANSSALGRKSRTGSLQEAISFIGVRRTIALILSTGVARVQGSMMGDLLPQWRLWYGRRSVLIANVAKAFAQRMEEISEETAYVLGLLQDTGILLLMRTYGNRYLELLQRVKEIPHLRLSAEEQREFGTTHAKVTAALLEQWELPPALAMIVSNHHRVEPSILRSESDLAFIRVMQIGEAASDFFECRTSQRFIMLRQLLDYYGTHNSEQIRSCLEDSVREVLESSQILSLPVPSELMLTEMIDDIREFANAEVLPDDCLSPGTLEASKSIAGSEENQPREKTSVKANAEHLSAGGPPRARILVIEDEEAIVKGVRAYLSSCDIEVLHAKGMVEALQYTENTSAILCDVHLGGEDGINVLRSLRDSGCTLPMIMMSGDRHRATVTRSTEVDILGYLIKPFSRKLLLEKLSKCAGLEFLRDAQINESPKILCDDHSINMFETKV